MSFALYRKYRPKFFSEIVGQEHIAKTLENELRSGRIVHSYLFSGPKGTGKTTVARLLAKSLNCKMRKNGESEPCNECPMCQAVNFSNALNIIEIDAASHTGVDNVRDKIIENVRFVPPAGKYKVFIIDEAHMLSGSAFNALLKTLEEPPVYVVFILATTELHKLPATIISRCQRFDFKRFAPKEIILRLKKLTELEGVKTDKRILERIAALSGGGMRDAESLFGQILSLGIKDIKIEDADLVLPYSDSDLALNFLESLIYKNGREAMLIVLEAGERGIDFKYFIDNILALGQRLLYFKITGDEDVFFGEEERERLQAASQAETVQDLIKILDVLILRRTNLNSLDIPSLPLELAVAEVCGEGQENNKTIKQESNKARKQESKKTIKQENKETTDEDHNISIKTAELGDIKNKWSQILEKVKDYNHSLPFILNLAEPIAFDGRKLILAIKYKLHKEKLDEEKNKLFLTQALKDVYNQELLVETIVDGFLTMPREVKEEVEVEEEFGG